MHEKKSVMEFRKKYKIKDVDSISLCRAIEEMGYTIVYFRFVNNNENVEFLIHALEIEDYVRSCKCFTYHDEKYRLLFLNEDLSDDEKVIVLGHEIGHIWNKHLLKAAIFGDDIQQEYEANEFLHFLLLSNKRIRKCKIFVLIVVFICLTVCLLLIKSNYCNKDMYTEHYYRTDSGERYHIDGCIYLKNKTNIYRLTKEEFDSGKYEPCSVCIPLE